MVKKIESNRIYISFVLLFILLLCTILTIAPDTILKNVNADLGMDGSMDGMDEDVPR